MVLSKKDVMFVVDSKGELEPQEVELIVDEEDPEEVKLKGQTIKAIPALRTEVKNLLKEISKFTEGDRDLDGEIIKKYCVEPKFTDKEIAQIKGSFASVIAGTILHISGLESARNKKAVPKEEPKKEPETDEKSP